MLNNENIKNNLQCRDEYVDAGKGRRVIVYKGDVLEHRCITVCITAKYCGQAECEHSGSSQMNFTDK